MPKEYWKQEWRLRKRMIVLESRRILICFVIAKKKTVFHTMYYVRNRNYMINTLVHR